MKFKLTHTLNGSRDEVMVARERRFENLDKFPELKKFTEVERRAEGNKLYITRRMSFGGHMPLILKGKVKDDALDCLEYSEIDKETHRHEFRLVSATNEKLFTFRGQSEYLEKEENGRVVTVRELKASCRVNLPLIGSAIEEFIVKQYKKSAEKDMETIEKMLEESRREK